MSDFSNSIDSNHPSFGLIHQKKLCNMKIPNGHQVLMPYLIVDGVEEFIQFVTKVFQADISFKGKNPDGSTGHCEVQIGGCTIMFSNSAGNWKARTADMFVYVENADETYAKAIGAGAVTVLEPDDKDYGRSGGVTDPFGNIWWITSIK
jgi:PhnB protein